MTSTPPAQAATGAPPGGASEIEARPNPYRNTPRISDTGPGIQTAVTPPTAAAELAQRHTNPSFNYGLSYPEEEEGANANATNATGDTNAAVESTTNETTVATVETNVGSEYNDVYATPDDPREVLFSQLRPLSGQPTHLHEYEKLMTTQVNFCQALQQKHDTLAKISEPSYTGLRSMSLSKLKLMLPTDPKDDIAYTTNTANLALEFEAAKVQFQQKALSIVKRSTEQHISSQQKRNGRIFLERVNSIAHSGASLRVDLEANKYKQTKATIGYMAVQQLLKEKESQPRRKLEEWLKLPDLPDLHNNTVIATTDPADTLNKNVQYATLEEGDRGLVDILARELAHYIPLCTYEYNANALRRSTFIKLSGALTARAKVQETRTATAFTEKAISFAATQSDQDASIHKQNPKGRGGQKTSMSTPKQQKGSKPKKSNGPPYGGKGKGKQQGKGEANGKKRKPQNNSPPNQPAKSQGNENDDEPKKKKQRQRRKPQSKQTTESENPISSANNAQPKNRRQQRRVGNPGGANNANNEKQRHV
jgi:hypothetical protein